MDQRANRPIHHRAHPRRWHDVLGAEGRPPEPRVREQHADRRRHGRPCHGARLPPRSSPAALPAQRVEQLLVRRVPPVSLLHGRTGADDRRVEHRLPVRRRLQARGHPRSGHAAGVLLGLRPSGPIPLPDARAHGSCRDDLLVRRELLDLRRKREEHDGRRVLLLDRVVVRDPRARCLRPRHGDRQVPKLGGDPSCPGDVVPRHRAAVRRPRRTADVGDLDGPHEVRVRPHRAGRSGAVERVLGRSLPGQSRLHDRHEVPRPTRWTDGLVLGHVLPVDDLPRHRGDRLRRVRVHRLGGSAPPRRGLAGDHLLGAHRVRVPGEELPAGHRAVVEPASVAVPLPAATDVDDGRDRRVRRSGRPRQSWSTCSTQHVEGRRGHRRCGQRRRARDGVVLVPTGPGWTHDHRARQGRVRMGHRQLEPDPTDAHCQRRPERRLDRATTSWGTRAATRTASTRR